jgi:hypothetical protein
VTGVDTKSDKIRKIVENEHGHNQGQAFSAHSAVSTCSYARHRSASFPCALHAEYFTSAVASACVTALLVVKVVSITDFQIMTALVKNSAGDTCGIDAYRSGA